MTYDYEKIVFYFFCSFGNLLLFIWKPPFVHLETISHMKWVVNCSIFCLLYFIFSRPHEPQRVFVFVISSISVSDLSDLRRASISNASSGEANYHYRSKPLVIPFHFDENFQIFCYNESEKSSRERKR